MTGNIFIRGARQLLTLNGPSGPRRGEAAQELAIVEDGSVLVTAGVISNVGPTRRIENLSEARNAVEVNAQGKVVLPAFVDASTHTIAAPPRGTRYAPSTRFAGDRVPGSDLVTQNLQYIRNSAATALEFQARRHVQNIARHGTGTLGIRSGLGLNSASEAKMLRVAAALESTGVRVVPTFYASSAIPPEREEAPAEHLNWICEEMIPRIADKRLARFLDVGCGPDSFDVESARRCLDAARRHGLPVRLQTNGAPRTGAVELALSAGAVSIEGLEEAAEAEADLLARSRTLAMLLPAVSMTWPQGRFAPARKLADLGAALALTSGFHPGTASTYNMQAVIAWACSHLNMTVEEAITAATVNASHALLLEAQTGSLQFGKSADLVILDIPDYRELQFVHGVNLVLTAIRNGQILWSGAKTFEPPTS